MTPHRELPPYSAQPAAVPASVWAAIAVFSVGVFAAGVVGLWPGNRAAAPVPVAPIAPDCPEPKADGDRTALVVRRHEGRLFVTCIPIPAAKGGIQPEKSMMHNAPARPPRIPLIAPPDARVFDVAQQQHQRGLRLVHDLQGLKLVPMVRPGQYLVGRAA